jgi:hypothetical protein
VSENLPEPAEPRPHGRWVRAISDAERDGQACRLYARGLTYAAVAREMGFKTGQQARDSVRRGLALAAVAHGADELWTRSVIELEELQRASWEVIADPGPMVNRAGDVILVEDPETGEDVVQPDQQNRVNAINAALKVNESLRRLRGLDAPKASVSMSLDQLRAQVEAMRREDGAGPLPLLPRALRG